MNPRHALGWVAAFAAHGLNAVAHQLIHLAAWLMDHEDIMTGCQNCQGVDNG